VSYVGATTASCTSTVDIQMAIYSSSFYSTGGVSIVPSWSYTGELYEKITCGTTGSGGGAGSPFADLYTRVGVNVWDVTTQKFVLTSVTQYSIQNTIGSPTTCSPGNSLTWSTFPQQKVATASTSLSGSSGQVYEVYSWFELNAQGYTLGNTQGASNGAGACGGLDNTNTGFSTCNGNSISGAVLNSISIT
jgi:hypothetical protein